LVRRMHDLLWDMRLNINTREIVKRQDCTSWNRDARWCRPSPYFRLQQIFKRISISDTDVFADCGCGSGRVACFAAHLTFKKVYGIELLSDIALAARRNAQKMRKCKAIIEIIEGDILNFDCKDVTIFFFYDPFGEKTMQDFLKRIQATLLESPRPVRLIYYGSLPAWEVMLDNTSWLHKREDLSIKKLTRGQDLVRFYEGTI
jgi:SAM-dependent methyltransferase